MKLKAYPVQIGDLKGLLVSVSLPEGLTGDRLLRDFQQALSGLSPQPSGPLLLLNGRMTLPMGFLAGHVLSHLCANLAVRDVKMDDPDRGGAYLVVTCHGGRYPVGDVIYLQEPQS